MRARLIDGPHNGLELLNATGKKLATYTTEHGRIVRHRYLLTGLDVLDGDEFSVYEYQGSAQV